MESARVREFRPEDLDGLLAALAVSAPTDAVTRETFSVKVLLDVNFQPGGLLVAEEDGRIVGALYAVVPTGAAAPVPADGGWITFFFVHPSWRGRGIGAELVERSLAWLKSQGAAWVAFSGYAPAYFLPGLDDALYPAAMRLLTRAGFGTRYSAVAMDANLASYSTPPHVLQLRARREAEGYSFRPAGYGDLPEAISFAATLAPDWGQVIRESTIQQGHPERVLTARDPAGVTVGFATYGSYGGLIERFGPFGVDENQRGTGLGTILLHVTLTSMRAEGAHAAWFLWTDETSPAGRLYLKSGFSVTRTFRIMQRELWNLDRFVRAQDAGGTYDQALAELRRGRKTTHWMWFVFPQLAGLGHSPMAERYAIGGVAEARAYLRHPVLGPRLLECAQTVADSGAASAEAIFGGIDAMKLRSSMTLFLRADATQSVFQRVLDAYFDGAPDAATDRLLAPFA